MYSDKDFLNIRYRASKIFDRLVERYKIDLNRASKLVEKWIIKKLYRIINGGY